MRAGGGGGRGELIHGVIQVLILHKNTPVCDESIIGMIICHACHQKQFLI